MPKLVCNYSSEEWGRLSAQEQADSWGALADAIKQSLERFDPHQSDAKLKWDSLKLSLSEALEARSRHLKKAWGLVDTE